MIFRTGPVGRGLASLVIIVLDLRGGYCIAHPHIRVPPQTRAVMTACW
jgi:hypothetical protein